VHLQAISREDCEEYFGIRSQTLHSPEVYFALLCSSSSEVTQIEQAVARANPLATTS